MTMTRTKPGRKQDEVGSNKIAASHFLPGRELHYLRECVCSVFVAFLFAIYICVYVFVAIFYFPASAAFIFRPLFVFGPLVAHRRRLGVKLLN